jgi:DNA-binding IclR family transcriptional regulator
MDKTTKGQTAVAPQRPKGKPVGAVVNAAKILRFLQAIQEPATVTQITRAVKINPSTCFNVLRTLIQEDFVQFDTTAKTYQLSFGLVALARGVLEHNPTLHLLKPKIEELSRAHRVMVTIWRKISEERIMLVAAAESDAAVRIHARTGTRSPLLAGASGRVFTAYSGMSRAALKERFGQLRLARPLGFESYLQQLEEVRRTGWALDDGYAYPGTITIAAPVLEPVGPLNFTCAAILFNGQYDLQRVAVIAEELKRLGHTLVDALPGFSGIPVQAAALPPPPRARIGAKKPATTTTPKAAGPRARPKRAAA